MNYLTHNGKITLENPIKGTHRTVKISTVKNGKYKGTRKVYLLIGQDNENDYLCLGFIKANGEFFFWDSVPEGSRKIVNLLYPKVMNNLVEKGLLKVHHEGKCRVCNRTLTNPESIRSGIGPICRGEI